MMGVLAVYERPYNAQNPVICLDEKSKQLLGDTKESVPAKQGRIKKRDYEYKRKSTANIFVAVEPKAGRRIIKVTKHRKGADFARMIKYIVLTKYSQVEKVTAVMDNLNTHNEKTIREHLSKEDADKIMEKLEIIHTPKHASWLDMAEIEIGVMSSQCLKGRIGTFQKMQKEVAAWSNNRNKDKCKIIWTFTREKAQSKFKFSYIGKSGG
jgi:hypothetical protein